MTIAVALLQRLRRPILVLWLCLTLLGAFFARRFTANTAIDFSVPEKAEGYVADREFKRYFPETSETVIALVERMDGGPVLGDALRQLTEGVEDWVAAHDILVGNDTVAGYYTLAEVGLADLGAQFVNTPADPSAATASIILVQLPIDDTEVALALERHVADESPSGLRVRMTGEPYFLTASLDGITHDVEQVPMCPPRTRPWSP